MSAALMRRDDLLLIDPFHLEEIDNTGFSEAELDACRKIAAWAQEYLCEGHLDLGRDGPVCPFTQPSIRKRLFWVTISREEELEDIASTNLIGRYLDWFAELEPKSGPETNFKTALILYPRISHAKAAVQIERIQRILKPKFVKRGLMIGQFYEGCPEHGLWSDTFLPLQSPVPLLAIRNMVPSDFPFLHGTRGNSEMLLSYFNKFGTNIPFEVKKVIVETLMAASRNDSQDGDAAPTLRPSAS